MLIQSIHVTKNEKCDEIEGKRNKKKRKKNGTNVKVCYSQLDQAVILTSAALPFTLQF